MKHIWRIISSLLLTTILLPSVWADWSDDDSKALTQEVEAGDHGTVTSLLISVDGRILYEHYFRGTNADTLHNTRSATKTITGLLVGAAIDGGLLKGVEEKVTHFFPGLQPLQNPDRRKDDITVKDFLTMSSMLECNDFNPYSRGNEERMYITENWVEFTLNLPIKGFAPWEQRPSDSPFGRSFSYCTAGVHTLGQIVAKVTGKSLDLYATERLFTPLGITDRKWPRTILDRAGAGGGLELSTRSLAKLGSLYVNAGQFEGSQIISESWVADTLASHVGIDDGQEYGYLLWKKPIEMNGKKMMLNYMSGNGGNRVIMMPEQKLLIVLTKTDFNQRGAHQKSDKLIIEGVLKRLLDD